MKIMAYVLIIDAIGSLQFGSYHSVCSEYKFGFYKWVTPIFEYIKLFAWSTDYDPEIHKYKIASTLFCSNQMLQDYENYIFYALNFGLAWDLIRTITNPFESVESR